jgi:hypothetical protein
MISSRHLRVAGVGCAFLLTLTGCALNSKEPDGSDLAAQSCSGDLLPVSAVSKIVEIGVDKTTPDKVKLIELNKRVQDDQMRSILSAKAVASNKYWQPLADAWALEEALARATLASLLSTKVADATGILIVDTRAYDKFVSNVNIDFAAVTKDTFCRIAFVKQNIEITYEK